jgi:hypothetical protein
MLLKIRVGMWQCFWTSRLTSQSRMELSAMLSGLVRTVFVYFTIGNSDLHYTPFCIRYEVFQDIVTFPIMRILWGTLNQQVNCYHIWYRRIVQVYFLLFFILNELRLIVFKIQIYCVEFNISKNAKVDRVVHDFFFSAKYTPYQKLWWDLFFAMWACQYFEIWSVFENIQEFRLGCM